MIIETKTLEIHIDEQVFARYLEKIAVALMVLSIIAIASLPIRAVAEAL